MQPFKEKNVGYSNCSLKATIFSASMELELANYVKNLDDHFHGLTPMKVRDLAYEFAKANNITLPTSWTLNNTILILYVVLQLADRINTDNVQLTQEITELWKTYTKLKILKENLPDVEKERSLHPFSKTTRKN